MLCACESLRSWAAALRIRGTVARQVLYRSMSAIIILQQSYVSCSHDISPHFFHTYPEIIVSLRSHEGGRHTFLRTQPLYEFQVTSPGDALAQVRLITPSPSPPDLLAQGTTRPRSRSPSAGASRTSERIASFLPLPGTAFSRTPILWLQSGRCRFYDFLHTLSLACSPSLSPVLQKGMLFLSAGRS